MLIVEGVGCLWVECITESITEAAGIRTTTIATTNRDSTLRTQDREVIAANGRDKVISNDRDGNGTFETVENLTVTLNPGTTRTNVLDVRNADGVLRTITSYIQSADMIVGVAGKDNGLQIMGRLDDGTIARQHYFVSSEFGRNNGMQCLRDNLNKSLGEAIE